MAIRIQLFLFYFILFYSIIYLSKELESMGGIGTKINKFLRIPMPNYLSVYYRLTSQIYRKKIILDECFFAKCDSGAKKHVVSLETNLD